ncbi:glycosyltransferase family 2 protein [Deinococcus yavapaiensis]|uniref:GT2 family glycosyltransferase n=1 Tax=Deinococcus yavapaiensis KR-236 TaxID=694435 RepID=A0A318S953_9DEIO|nr:glycosyltransferase family 2 protein [Deinococcus yavapaiensis]PYE55741.1 GT2 family glycosyltransferase [Deinococcus yavapaiensis KR-236]
MNSNSNNATASFRPIKVVDVELSDPPAPLSELQGYGSVRCLVRLYGDPVGHVELPLAEDLRDAATLRARLVSHLEADLRRWHLTHFLQSVTETTEWSWTNALNARPEPWRGQLPSLTVAVCTRDRPDDLALCLEAISRLDYPDLDVVVVDNAPTSDATRELVRDHFAFVRYVREERPGLDFARNRAALEARGEIVAYTDDDVIVDSKWARAIGEVFAENPGVMAVTGLVAPYELETEAQVLFERYGGFGRGYERRWYGVDTRGGQLAAREAGGGGRFGTGANMAYRRRVFDDIGFFDPALDVGTVTNGGGDLEMFFRVLKAGHVLVYEPRAIVRHRHRRDIERLRTQLANNGVGFYSHLVRTFLHYPDERAGILRFGAWWFDAWSVRRFLKSLVRPQHVPREFITAELVGSLRGLSRYQRARENADKLARPTDPPFVPTARRHTPSSGGVAVRHLHIDTDVPAIGDVSAYAATFVVVFKRGRPIGQMQLGNWYHPLSASRLRDELVRHFGIALLDDRDANVYETVASSLKARYVGRTSLPATSVSILVATRDRPEDLRRALQGLTRQETKHDVEIVVVDNHPASNLTRDVVAAFPGVRLVSEARPGSSYARNAGIAACRGTIIAVTDDDLVIPESWLDRIVAPFERQDVMAVTGLILPLELETKPQQLFEEYGGLGRGYERFEVSSAWFRAFRRKAVPTWQLGATANAAFRASIFRDPRIGPMEEVLGAGRAAGVGEDTYLFYKILKAGGTIVYEPSAFVLHQHRRTMDALRRQLYAYSKGHVAYHLLTFLRHGDARALLQVGAFLPYWHTRRLAGYLRAWARGFSRSYPLSLTLLEVRGSLEGPAALWRSLREVRRLDEAARAGRDDPPGLPSRGGV